MPTQPYARKVFLISVNNSTSGESDLINFPLRRWDDGIVVLAVNHKLSSGTANITIKARLYYRDIGWTDYKTIYDEDSNSSFASSTAGSVIALPIDRQAWWKVSEGIQFKIESTSSITLEAKCALLAR